MSALHDRPRCYGCRRTVDNDPLFAAPCGHEDCASAVWHGLCLMEHREHWGKRLASLRRFLSDHGLPVPPHLEEGA